MSQFLSAVEQGLITTPCALMVESLDRLGGDELGKAQARFQALLASGVTVVTLADNQEYSPESTNDLGRIMISLVTMYRAHEKSHIKAVRSKAAWDHCRATSNIKHKVGITTGWLKKASGGEGFELIPDRVEVVQRIFNMALQSYGSVRLTAKIVILIIDIYDFFMRKSVVICENNRGTVCVGGGDPGRLVIKKTHRFLERFSSMRYDMLSDDTLIKQPVEGLLICKQSQSC